MSKIRLEKMWPHASCCDNMKCNSVIQHGAGEEVGSKERTRLILPEGCCLLDICNEVNAAERMFCSYRAEKAENFGWTGISALRLSGTC